MQGLKLDIQFERRVASGIVVTADTPPWLLMTHVYPEPRFKGVLLYCEGAGQITDEVWEDEALGRSYSWIDVIREATERGMYIGIVSPFEDGSVDLTTYELGVEVAKAGGIGMKSLVPAMADFKFRQALAMFPNDPDAIREYCQTDIVGELLQRTADIKQFPPFTGL